MNNTKQLIIDWLIDNKLLIQEMSQDLTNQLNILLKEESIEFHNDIRKDYYDGISFLIEVEAAKNLAISVQDVRIVLDEIDLGDYLI